MCDLNKPAEKGPQSNDNRIEDDSVNTVVAPSLDGSNTAPSGDEPAMKSSLNWIELSVIDLIKDVPLLGDVLIGYHAKRRMLDLGILEGSFMTVLMHPRQRDTPDGSDILFRERNGIRIVILDRRETDGGKCFIKTVFRLEAKMRFRR